ncbi:MAG: GlsB/YeaQ/YmgE family stress response membrane protein [Coriobacteriia bacterium]|nr:GlsB/YeaQ/YmgE family stress response membrane protein [Coriobacteriia bacterium]
MGIFSWIFVGLVAGLLAKWIMPGDQKAGFFVTMALGILGALLGGGIMSLIGKTAITGFNLTTLLVATGGAVLVLVIYGLVRKSPKR